MLGASPDVPAALACTGTGLPGCSCHRQPHSRSERPDWGKEGGATSLLQGRHGAGSANPPSASGLGPIHMSRVQCTGRERSLGECRFQDAERSGCRHEADAAVRCHVPHMDFQSQVSPRRLPTACGAPAPPRSRCPPSSAPGVAAQTSPTVA